MKQLKEYLDMPKQGGSDCMTRRQLIYRYLFSCWLLQSGIFQETERLLQDAGIDEADDSEKDEWQKEDLMGLKYIYLRCSAHIERLSPGQLEELDTYPEKYRNCNEEDIVIPQLIMQTYRVAFAVNPMLPKQRFELFPSIYGEGIVTGETVVFGLATGAVYDEQGMLTDEDQDAKRIQMSFEQQHRLQKELTGLLGTTAAVFVEI